MNVFAAELTYSENEALQIATVQNASLERPADIVSGLMTNGFSDALSSLNLGEMKLNLQKGSSYRIAVITTDGREAFYGFSTMSLLTAIGAATVSMIEAQGITLTPTIITI